LCNQINELFGVCTYLKVGARYKQCFMLSESTLKLILGKVNAHEKWINTHVDIRMQKKIAGQRFVHLRCLKDVTTCITKGCIEEPRKHRSRAKREFSEDLEGRHQRYCSTCKAKRKQQRNAAEDAPGYHIVPTPFSVDEFVEVCDVKQNLKSTSQTFPVVLMQALTEALALLYGAPTKVVTSALLDTVAHSFREFDFSRKRLQLDQR
jgi:hypothetical protein